MSTPKLIRVVSASGAGVVIAPILAAVFCRIEVKMVYVDQEAYHE